MLSKAMASVLNEQVNAEMYSSNLYLSMSSYASFIGLKGAANWFYLQCQEEMDHAKKIYDYIISHGEHALLQAIDQPPTKFESLRDMFEKTLEHEQLVTGLINNLANLAVDEKDHATNIFLQWFVSEQVEEEDNVNDILNQLNLAGDSINNLFMIDKELLTRKATTSVA